MDNDLDRSVRLLEDALSTPSGGMFRKKLPTLRKDMSFSMDPDEIQKLLKDTVNHSMYDNTMHALLHGDKTVMGSVIQAGAPWKNTVDSLYMEFVEIVQSGDALEVAADLGRCCSDALKVVQGLKAQVAVTQLPEEKWLENERNTWRLLYVLYQDRFNVSNAGDEPVTPYMGHSEKLCIGSLFKRDSLVRESQLVIDWLERNALERDDPILHHSDWTSGWEHTIHQLFAPDSIAIGSTTEIVSHLHPDAPQFEGLPLHHLDTANEKQLHHRIFVEIRCGKLDSAQELLFNCGQPWAVALLEGWKLYHNPNINESNLTDNGDNNCAGSELEYRDIEGNANRDLWKVTALEYCKKDNINIHMKAAVSSFCGHLETLLSVCTSWEDYLWAYMKCLVDIRVESEIRDNINRSYIPLPEEYWEQKMSLNDVFAALEASRNQSVQTASSEPDHIIQKYIILDDVAKLMSILEKWTDDLHASTHFLRFLAHLVLFFDMVGECPQRKSCEKIIEAYISRLSGMNETQLVAFYVSKLGVGKQVPIYASHLEKIVDNDERKAALVFGEDNGLDIFGVTKMVVENVRNQPTDVPATTTLNEKIMPCDEMKISALDWVIFYEIQRAEALTQSNALIFTFLTLGKVDAAQQTITKIPPDTVDKIRSEGDVNAETDQLIKDHLSYKEYLKAHEVFNVWFKQFQSKPQPPARLPDNAQFTEQVAHQHRVSQYNAELERWKLTTSHSAKSATTLLYNVLLFPTGWLVGGEDADYLRSICLPEIVLLLYTVLSKSEMHEEAVQLADLIASEKYALYKVYSKEKLGEILGKLCESSLVLLNAKKDPWGNASIA